jgi:hypothetical protein
MMQETVAILPSQQLAMIHLASEFTIRFSILGTGTNNGNILKIAAEDRSVDLLTISSTFIDVLQIDYYDSLISAFTGLLPPDWQVAWTTVEITVSLDRLSISSSFNSTPTVVTGFGLFNTSGKLFAVRAASDDQESAGGFIRDVEISGNFDGRVRVVLRW